MDAECREKGDDEHHLRCAWLSQWSQRLTRYFKAELVARAFVAYLGASFDALVMLEHIADHETDHRMPDPVGL
jgi:hypothetical protein